MKKYSLFLLVLIVQLMQSCGLSRDCRDAKSLSSSQAEEISHQRLEYEDLLQRFSLISEDMAKQKEENQVLYKDYVQLSEQLKEAVEVNEKLLQEDNPVSSGNPFNENNRPVKEIIVNEIDTVTRTLMKVSTGNVAFYCPRKVTYKEPFTALGFIADVISDERIRQQLLERVREVERDPVGEKLADEKTLIEKIQFYKLIELRLDEAGNSAFEIKKIHLEDKQEVSDKMEGWQWKIIPVSKDSRQELVLKVIVYNADGKVDYAFNKTRFIDIEVRSGAFFHNIKLQFVENPEWAYGSVILPFITFLAGNYQKRKKKKSGEEAEPENA
ncbi:MAG: hypothetical protein AB9834_06275 [Lentimicrobium sp.]